MRLVSILALSTLLTACGASSGGDTSTSTGGTTDSAPTVTASADQTVNEGSAVTLSASAFDADGDSISYAWTQTGTDTVSILGATNEATLTFTAPDVNADTNYGFTVTVTANGSSVNDSVSVTVLDVQDVSDEVTDALLAELEVLFSSANLVKPLEVVECDIAGATTACLSIEIASLPTRTVGPFCPRLTTDTIDEGGLWLQTNSGVVSEVDGTFVTNLNTLYNDQTWQMFDANTNEIFYTETTVECQAAANPDPDTSLANHCVECSITHLGEIEAADGEITHPYLIPLFPVAASATNASSDYGLSLSGSILNQPAPTNLIEANYNIAPFDDCGGHINPFEGYHIHAVTDASVGRTTDCYLEVEAITGHAAQIGLALDGYPIFDRLNGITEPTGLDTCNGIDSSDEGFGTEIGYHYHVNEGGDNQILPCLSGEIEGDTDTGGGMGGPGG